MARIAVVIVSLALAGTLPADAVARTKHCKKGYVLKTVKRHGKKVKVCKKRKKKPGTNTQTNTGTNPGTNTGTNPGTDTGTNTDTGGGTTTPFPKPAAQTTGEDAFTLIAPFFVNSHFTDCPNGGWPNCAVEQIYRHCAGGGKNGGFEYHRYTSTSGADINSYGTYYVRSAESNPDGSWKIEYNVDSYGNLPFYHWEVSPDGSVVGNYYFPGPNPSDDPDGPERLGPLVWQQPAGCATR